MMNLNITSRERWSFIFWACLMLVLMLALIPAVDYMPTTGWDKLNHLLVFAILLILGHQAYPGHNAGIFLGLLLYGGLIEILQSFTLYRSAELADLFADGLGLIIGWVLHGLYHKSTQTDYSD